MKKNMNVFLFFVLLSYTAVSAQEPQLLNNSSSKTISINEPTNQNDPQQATLPLKQLLSDKLIEQQQSLAQLIEAKERLEEDLAHGIDGLQRRDKKEILKVLELHKKAIAKKLAELELITPEDEEYEQNASEWTTTQKVLLWTAGSLIVLTTATGIFLAMYDIGTGGMHAPSNDLLKKNLTSMLEKKASKKKTGRSIKKSKSEEAADSEGEESEEEPDDSEHSDSGHDDDDDTAHKRPAKKKAKKAPRDATRDIDADDDELIGSPEEIDLPERNPEHDDDLADTGDLAGEDFDHHVEETKTSVKKYGKKVPTPTTRKTRAGTYLDDDHDADDDGLDHKHTTRPKAKTKPKAPRAKTKRGRRPAAAEDAVEEDEREGSDPFATEEKEAGSDDKDKEAPSDVRLKELQDKLAQVREAREKLEEAAAGDRPAHAEEDKDPARGMDIKDPDSKTPVALGQPGGARRAMNWVGTSRPVNAVKRAGNWLKSW